MFASILFPTTPNIPTSALDVNSPLQGESLNRYDPGSSYTESYLSRVFSVVDAFKGYPNLLGFFAGNEVVNDIRSASVVPPYIRAVQRDLKQYIAKNADRVIPVGYSAADEDNRRPMWAYLSCGDDAESRADFYGLNSYEWCGDSTWETSGYQNLVTAFANTSIPLFFSEFGCNTVKPRPFNEIQAIYGPRMIDDWSGGLVYEYSEEPSDYGLVNISSNGDATLRKDYDNLQSQYNKINITLITTRSASASTVAHPSCNNTFILLGHTATFNTSMTLPPCPALDLIANGVDNKNVGKLVTVTDLKTQHKVFTSGGAQIENIAIVPLPADKSNTPGGENTSGSVKDTTNTTVAATDDKKEAAGGRLSMSWGVAVVAGVVGMILGMV